MVQNLAPAVCLNAIFVDVFEDLDFVSSAVDIKSVFVPDKGVVGPGLWRNLPVWALLQGVVLLRAALEFVPLLLDYFVLEQVVEVNSSLASVASEEVKAVSVRNRASS